MFRKKRKGFDEVEIDGLARSRLLISCVWIMGTRKDEAPCESIATILVDIALGMCFETAVSRPLQALVIEFAHESTVEILPPSCKRSNLQLETICSQQTPLRRLANGAAAGSNPNSLLPSEV